MSLKISDYIDNGEEFLPFVELEERGGLVYYEMFGFPIGKSKV